MEDYIKETRQKAFETIEEAEKQISKLKDKLSRRNMQIKELKKEKELYAQFIISNKIVYQYQQFERQFKK